MKFSNGFWLKKKGVECFSPVEIYDISTENGGTVLKLYCPTQKVYNRGCTLGGVALTIRISVPVCGIFDINMTHYEGLNSKQPHYKLENIAPCKLDIKDENGKVLTCENLHNHEFNKLVLKSGNTGLTLDKDLNFEFSSGEKYLTKIKASDLAYIRCESFGDAYVSCDDINYVSAATNLSVDEHIYGLGERFGAFVKNGQSIKLWNEDGGTSTEQSYKNIPFYISDRGYGVFVNDTGAAEYEVGSELVGKTSFSVKGESIDFWVICGEEHNNSNYMKDVLNKYTTITGRPGLPPAWTFGLWLSTSFTTDYDEETVMHFIDKMKEADIPLSVFHFDCFWMKAMSWCNFEWNKDVFSDPEGMINRIKAKGLKVCVWINPYIAQNSALFVEGVSSGYFLKKLNGDVWQWDMWQSGMAIVDFTNPEAVKWYQSKLANLLDMGVDCFKTDFGERIPVDGVQYYDNTDPERMHNYYSILYNEAVYNIIKEKKGVSEAVLFARSATAGGQKFPVHWGGDCTADYESMAESLRGGLSLTMSGFGYWSHDIGGFEDTSSADVYKRWLAFGLMSSHSRLHGSNSYRVPWLYDDEAVKIAGRFAKLKNRLMPYLYSSAVEAHEHGIPVMRSMILEFPNDSACKYLDRQYMLGDDLLVAPVFNEKGMVSLYLPDGRWTDFFCNKTYEGGRWYQLKNIAYNTIPCFIREGSVIPMGTNEETPVYDYSTEVELYVYKARSDFEKHVKLYNNEGRLSEIVTVTQNDGNIICDIDEIKMVIYD